MSRGYDTRRKERRRQAQPVTASEGNRPGRTMRLVALLPGAAIIAVLLGVAALGIGAEDSPGTDKRVVRHEVAALLEDIPQQGTTLGSSNAPVTLLVFADAECPTVKQFVETFLPSIIDTWVRNGLVKLEYRSLKTDTYDEQTFFRQEVAALAAGRQDKLWNYFLTSVREQGKAQSGYADEEFLARMASQVDGLSRERWQRSREDALLTRQVSLDLHSAHEHGLQFTPSFLIRSDGERDGASPVARASAVRVALESSLRTTVSVLAREASGDIPEVGALEPERQASEE